MSVFLLIAIITLAYGLFRVNNRCHKSAAHQDISALRRELEVVTAKCLENPNISCLSALDEAIEAESGASFYFGAGKFVKAEAQAKIGLWAVQAAHEALLFSKPEFRVLATGCSGR